MTLPTVENAAEAPAFVAERDRLLAALRHVTDRGVIEQIAQVGAASIPGLPAFSLLEMAITMWPFPLEAPVLTQLADPGYMRVPSAEETGCVRFRHVTGAGSDFTLQKQKYRQPRPCQRSNGFCARLSPSGCHTSGLVALGAVRDDTSTLGWIY